jgi:hypothetical protein
MSRIGWHLIPADKRASASLDLALERRSERRPVRDGCRAFRTNLDNDPRLGRRSLARDHDGLGHMAEK